MIDDDDNDDDSHCYDCHCCICKLSVFLCHVVSTIILIINVHAVIIAAILTCIIIARIAFSYCHYDRDSCCTGC